MRSLTFAILFAAVTPLASPTLASEVQLPSTMTIVNSSVPGGGTDAKSRLVARHINRLLPGHPQIIVRNMPGAGGLTVASHLYNVAPRDGSVFGSFPDAIAFAPLVQANKVDFVPQNFFWIGSLTSYTPLLFVRSDSRIKTFEQALAEEVSIGATGAGSISSVYPTVLNGLFGTKLKVINGYRGSANVNLAIERGEVDGYAAWCWSCMKTNKPDWISNNRVRILMQLTLDGDPELNRVGVRTLSEVVKSPSDRQLVNIVFGGAAMAQPFALPPNVPQPVAQKIRSAFETMAKDEEFLQDAKKIGEEITFVPASTIISIMKDAYAASDSSLARLRSIISTMDAR